MVSGCVAFLGVFAPIVRPSRSLRARFVRKVSSFFKWSAGPAPARIRTLSGIFHSGLTSTVEGDHLFRRLAGLPARVPQPIERRSQADQWVRTRTNLVHRIFISQSRFPQVAEGRCSAPVRTNRISVERDSVRKEQLLEPLALVE
jgi:hypothetical protein